MNYKFGKSSLKHKKTIHVELELILESALEKSPMDFGISDGFRSKDRQHELYRKGLSKIDGHERKGKHNVKPSMAVDIYAYHSGKAQFDQASMCFLAGVILGVAEDLRNRGIIKHRIRWGGNWNMDGVIIYDQSFQDLCHFEMV